MSQFDNGFKKAQRSFDQQEPPECETVAFDCDECDGNGYVGKGEVCKKCDGNGYIELSPAEVKALKKDIEPEPPDMEDKD